MDLLLVRHAIAEERSAARPDHERSLTPAGIQKLDLALAGLGGLGLVPEVVLSSPWRRALQTAERLARPATPRVTDALCRDADEELFDELEGLDAEVVALVGHEPWMSDLASWLIGSGPLAPPGLRLRKSGVAWLRGVPYPDGMELQALLRPSLLRRVGRLQRP